MRRFRIARFAAGLVFLAVFLGLILVPSLRPGMRWFGAVQFYPSIVLLLGGSLLGLIGVAVLLGSSLFLGRTYCSVLCPLGVMQDLVSKIRIRPVRIRLPAYARNERIFHFVFAGLLAVGLLTGYGSWSGWFDPFSLPARFVAGFRPVSPPDVKPRALRPHQTMGVPAVATWTSTDQRQSLGLTDWVRWSFAILPAGLILLLVPFFGRWYCNSLCPVGAVLRFTSRWSRWTLALGANCTSCGACAKVCPAGCIDPLKRSLDFTRCVMCMDCVRSCPVDAVVFSRRNRTGRDVRMEESRRSFLAVSAGLIAITPFLTSASQVPKRRSVMPPSAGKADRFHRTCSACGTCANACPTGVLVPSVAEYGLRGLFQPRMDFSRSFCDYECVRCTRVCPTGALKPLTRKEKGLTVMGRVRLIKPECIPYKKGKDCGACAEHCPTQAVHMVPYGKVFAPVTNPDICVGCGACEKVCPVKPQKAIVVDGLEIQARLARDPHGKGKGPARGREQFPF